MRYNTLECILPLPQKRIHGHGKLFCSNIARINGSSKAKAAVDILQKTFQMLEHPLNSREGAGINFIEQAMKEDAYRINISENGIEIISGSPRGFFYAAAALNQMLLCAVREGFAGSFLDTGSVEDFPRFAWRGFMLDSARHYQSADFIKSFLYMLALHRINVFHWHLSDNQSWRIDLQCLPGLAGSGTLNDGVYTREDIKSITALAAQLGIAIVPEIDVPGHSEMLLKKFPQYRCDPHAEHCREFCLGNPASSELIKKIFDELLELFPDSKFIHIGGDEAAVEHWQQCPRCQQAMREKNLTDLRALENDFMQQIANHIVRHNRTPILWGGGAPSSLTYDSSAVIQAWLDIREPIKLSANGNNIIYSVHNSLYFDYPANQHEPQKNWMFELSERGVYLTDPYMVWQEKVEDHLLGLEACLWTETIPQWRVFSKLLSRLNAYSEAAWSNQVERNFDDFLRRENYLAAAGYSDLIKTLCAQN